MERELALLACANVVLRAHRAAGMGPFCTLLVDDDDAIPVDHFLARDGYPPRRAAR